MRTFEVVLILVNMLALVLSFRKQSKRIWLGIVAVNLSVLLIHGMFEGFRYQMAFSYMFVALLAIFSFIKLIGRSEAKTPGVLKFFVISLSFVFLVATSFLAYALPVFKLPKPVGSYDVGVHYFHWVDEDRTDPFLDTSTKPRELMVKVYYPAKADNTKRFSSYFHSPQLIELFAEFYGMPDFMFDHLGLVKTNSKESLQISDHEESYPVILFSHGAGTTMEVQTTQSEDLASHGYIVVTIDHTYVSAATVFPDKIVSHKQATTDFNVPEPAEIITQIMADDSKFVIEKLGELNDGTLDAMFTGKINLDQIGAIGHSVGGAVAYNLALNDSQVKAAIDLDGRVYIAPKDEPKNIAPFLMLASDTYIQTIEDRKSLMKKFEELTDEEQKIILSMYGSKDAYQEAYSKDTQNVLGLAEVLKASGNLFTIKGSDHMKFTDIGLFIGVRQLRELIGIRGETEPARCLEITKALTVVFFDGHLKGEINNSPESLLTKYPELQKVNLK